MANLPKRWNDPKALRSPEFFQRMVRQALAMSIILIISGLIFVVLSFLVLLLASGKHNMGIAFAGIAAGMTGSLGLFLVQAVRCLGARLDWLEDARAGRDGADDPDSVTK
jgi:hypothetical protein